MGEQSCLRRGPSYRATTTQLWFRPEIEEEQNAAAPRNRTHFHLLWPYSLLRVASVTMYEMHIGVFRVNAAHKSVRSQAGTLAVA